MDSQTTEKVLVTLTPVQLKDIYEKAAAIGAKEALKAFEQERKKEFSSRSDRRLRNTTPCSAGRRWRNRRWTYWSL